MAIKKLTLDDFKKSRNEFKPNKSAESAFYRALKKVARASGHIVGVHIDGTSIIDEHGMTKALADYSKLIGPWAARQSAKLITSISSKNKRAYRKNSKVMADELRMGVAEQNVGQVAAALMAEQLELIKSIPIEAGQRAQKLHYEAIEIGQKLALEGYYNGSRADEIAKELQNTTGVTESRAQLIAVTEAARANASITEARATAVGSRRYIWRTTMDGAERHSHALMNGKYVEYAKPPTLSDGTKGHAGTFPRCRCYQEPVFDD